MNTGWDTVSSGRADDRNMEQLAQGEDGKTLDVSDWPGGLAPVWTLLAQDSARALGAEPNAADGAVRFASDLDDGELAQSVFVAASRRFGGISGRQCSCGTCLMKKA